MQPNLSIIVVSYRDAVALNRCLRSIVRFGGLGHVTREVIVVKNSNETLDASELPDSYLTLVQNEKNEGFGAAVNRAAWLARGSHLLLLNPDAELQPDSLSSLLSFLGQHKEAAIIGLKQRASDGEIVASFGNQPNFMRELAALTGISRLVPVGRLVRAKGLLKRQYQKSGRRGWIGCGAACINKNVFTSFGGFDAGYFMYVEDVDLCRRIRNAQGEIWYCAEANVIHNDAATRVNPSDRKVAQTQTTHGLIRYAKLYRQPVAPMRLVQQIKELVRT